MSKTTLALVLMLPALACSPVAAQDWRTVTSSRQATGEESLSVSLAYGAGRLTIRPGDERLLYHSTLEYDASVMDPVSEYRNGRLRIGVETTSRFRGRNIEPGRLDLTLGRGVPLDLDLKFGAGEADIELGGLPIRRAEIAKGATETTIRFSEPNPERLRRLELKVGAAAFRVQGLGNANVDRLDVSGGVGDVTLDFTGDWRGDLTGEVKMGVGSLTLVLPRDVGVRIARRGVLSSFDSQRLTKRGDDYYSENWDSAEHRIDLHMTSAIGAVNVRWAN